MGAAIEIAVGRERGRRDLTLNIFSVFQLRERHVLSSAERTCTEINARFF